MTNSQVMLESTQPDGIMQWIIAISEVVNADSRLTPNKATQKRLQELIETYGQEKVWDGIKQYSMALAALRANPVIEWQFESPPATAEDLKPILDLIFHKREDMP